jgi:glucosamine-6-phosphate deaminase
MIIRVFDDKVTLGKVAAEQAAKAIQQALTSSGKARVVAASAASQFQFLDALTTTPQIDWKDVQLFHLDEYIGLPMTHPASFCRFLQEHLISRTGIRNAHLLNGEDDPAEVVRRANKAIGEAPIDIAFVGVGENGHLAFNDPPADFKTEEPYIIVNLDEACRCQQVSEGWFKNFAAVPRQAISMSVKQVVKAKEIIAVVPDARKAEAIKACFGGGITPLAPASILRTHPNTTIYLDKDSATLLTPETLAEFAASA